MVLNCHVLVTTHLTKRTAEAIGWHNGYLRRILSRWTQCIRRYRRSKWRIILRKGGKKQLDYILTDKTLLLEQRRRGHRHDTYGKGSQMCHGEVRDLRKNKEEITSKRSDPSWNRRRLKKKENWRIKHVNMVLNQYTNTSRRKSKMQNWRRCRRLRQKKQLQRRQQLQHWRQQQMATPSQRRMRKQQKQL